MILNGLYCAYLRKSRKDMEAEARGEGETLARHERILMDLAKRYNISLTAVYKEIVSGETIAARPVMQQLLREVEQGMWDGVLVVEIERLARGDTRDQGYVAEAFTYSDTKIITPVKIYDPSDTADQEYFEFSLFMSRREYKTINRRLASGLQQSFLEGKYLGNIPPYGWERYKLKKEKGFSLRPDPEESPYLQLMYHLLAYGDAANGTGPIGPDMIARRFNDMGVPTRAGSKWTGTTIREIIANEHNIGYVRRGKRRNVKKLENGVVIRSRPRQKEYELSKGLHDPLVSKEVFDLANKNMHCSNHPPVNQDRSTKNPLAGIVRCAYCGHVMRRRSTTVKSGYEFLHCVEPGCPNVGSPLHLVENAILETLRQWAGGYEVRSPESGDGSPEEMIKIKTDHFANLNKMMDKIKAQRSALYDLLEQGVYTTDVFLARQKTLNEREEQTREEIRATEEEIGYQKNLLSEQSSFAPRCRSILENYDSLSVVEKNRLLKELIDKVVYEKREKNAKGKGEVPNFKLDVYPKVPKYTGSESDPV